jgi:hypothetical protein
VRPGQVAGTHQEFVYDFAACKPKLLFEQFHPFGFGQRMVVLYPLPKAAELLLQLYHHTSIVNSGFHFQPIANDACIIQQAGPIGLAVGGDLANIKLMIGFAEIGFLFEDGGPAQACLVDLKEKPAKKFIVIRNGKPIQMIVVVTVLRLFSFGKSGYKLAIRHAAFF